MRVAAVDIGTNSVLLLVAERRGDEIVSITDVATITRLGQGVDATRALAPEAIDRTLRCLSGFATTLRDLGAERIDVVGTSAMRDASGGERFVSEARALLGVAPRTIAGEEEAALSFEGALLGLGLPAGPVLVFDVGGGSTELVTGRTDGGAESARSLDIGAVRLTERHLRADPPRPDELEAVRRDVRVALAGLEPPRGVAPPALVGVAGTVTTLAALEQRLERYDPGRVHGARIPAPRLHEVAAELASMALEQRRALPGLDPARADVIVAGAALVDELVQWAHGGAGAAGELIVSDRGVRWGLAARMLRS